MDKVVFAFSLLEILYALGVIGIVGGSVYVYRATGLSNSKDIQSLTKVVEFNYKNQEKTNKEVKEKMTKFVSKDVVDVHISKLEQQMSDIKNMLQTSIDIMQNKAISELVPN